MKVPRTSSWFGAIALNWTICVQMSEYVVVIVLDQSFVPTRYM